MEHPIVLFDGVCNFCNASVNFILDRDPAGRFRFAPLQSDVGQELLRRTGQPPDRLDSLVLVEGEKAYLRSTAALRIARRLPLPWSLSTLLLVVPAVLRDPFYNLLARNRYRWFGRSDACRMPTPQLRERFLA